MIDFGSKITNTQQNIVETWSRPLRVSFIVNRNVSSSTIRELLCYNTSLWGGYYNLFVPTDGESIRADWWNWLIHHDGDVIYLVGNISSELAKNIYDSLQPLQIFRWAENSYENLKGSIDKINPVTVLSILQKRHEQRGNVDSSQSTARYINASSGKYRDYFDFRYGLYFSETPFQTAFEEVLGATGVACDPQSFSQYLELIQHLDDKYVPLQLSASSLKASLSNWYVGETIVVINDSNSIESVDDLFIYYALKWSHADRDGVPLVFVVPLDDMLLADCLDTFVEWLTPKLNGTFFTLASFSCSFEMLKTIRSELKKRFSALEHPCYIDIQRCNFDAVVPDAKNNKRDQRIDRNETSIEFEITKSSLNDWIEPNRRLIFELDYARETSGSRQAYLPAMFPDLNLILSGYTDYRAVLGWGNRVRIARGKLAFPVTPESFIGNLRLPDSESLFNGVAKNGGYKVVKTRNAYYRSVLRLLGSLERVEFLRNPFLNSLFLNRDLLSKKAFTRAELQNRLKVKGAEQLESFAAWVQKLSGAQILLRGFNLTCPYCELHAWYDIGIVAEYTSCQGCRSPIQFPANVSPAYKLNLLLADHNQGTVTVLLTMLLLHEVSRFSFIWQTDSDVETSDDVKTNLDLLCMCDGLLVVCECKNSFATSNQDEINELIQQLEKNVTFARSVDARLMLFATLQDDIPKAVIDLLEREDAAPGRLRVKLITRSNLLSGKLEIDNSQHRAAQSPLYDMVKPLPKHQALDCGDDDQDGDNVRRLSW